MIDRYEVIRARVWRRDDGRTASIYGAVPWTSEAERSRWEEVTVGWTIRDNERGTVGVGRVPWKERDDAVTHCNFMNAKRKPQ